MFYVEKDNEIKLADNDLSKIQNTIEFIPDYKGLEIKQTDKDIIYHNNKFVFAEDIADELLIEAKAKKQEENVQACNTKRYNQEFTIILQGDKECSFDTSEQTQRDLLTAGGVTSRGLVYEGWICNNGTEIDLTETDIQDIFQKFFMMVSPLYAIEKQYAEAINACTTIEEVKAIELNYEINI